MHNRSLVSITDYNQADYLEVLDRAAGFEKNPTQNLLSDKLVATLFFEPSTRTRLSFETAVQRLGGRVIGFADAAYTSVSKGETLKDTIKMVSNYADLIIIRHPLEGSVRYASEIASVPVINAGDGWHAHPTQALLDMMTIRQKLGKLEGLKVAIIGDIFHSRVARSNAWGMKTMGMDVVLCGPPTLLPQHTESLGVPVTDNVDEALEGADVVMLLRLQMERQSSATFPSIREYRDRYGVDLDRLSKLKENVVIMHPGPVNRGVELASNVADSECSVILDQVTNGVAVRMAVLYLLGGGE